MNSRPFTINANSPGPGFRSLDRRLRAVSSLAHRLCRDMQSDPTPPLRAEVREAGPIDRVVAPRRLAPCRPRRTIELGEPGGAGIGGELLREGRVTHPALSPPQSS